MSIESWVHDGVWCGHLTMAGAGQSSTSTKAAAPAGGQLPDDEVVEGEDAISKLKRLKELLDLGAISQAEFDEKKAPLMSRI